jgi:hypothetical protein
MGEHATNLVADPALLQSLRKLYREYHPTIQAWLIPEPGAPLPPLVDPTLPLFQGAGALDHSFTRSLRLLQRRHPEMKWNATRTDTFHGSIERGLSCVSVPSARLHAIITLPKHSVTSYRAPASPWADELITADITLHDGVLQFSRLGKKATYLFRADGGLDIRHYDTPPAVNVSRWIAGEVLADGTGDDLVVVDGSTAPTPCPTQPVSPEGWSPDDPAACQERLLARWGRLSSPKDRARIATFWLGHEHPILAAAGLIIATKAQSRRRTH